ncbi:uncharacterized protein [Cicer arietinum]|uniref:Uncharacterized protein LOC105852602 n=1 Tax=Cicer arietinum TaxID=3827 RepID=A0A1S3EFL6_CICAR|nr:uncharacterized protein LOC105852602 [Cicer arietinum]
MEKNGHFPTNLPIFNGKNYERWCAQMKQMQLMLEKIIDVETAKGAWDTLKSANEGADKLKKLEELQGSLEAHELRIKQRSSDKVIEQALQAQTSKKNFIDRRKFKKGKWKNQKRKRSCEDTSEQGAHEGNKKEGNTKYKKMFDKKGIQCFNCQKYGHFANECKHNKSLQRKDDEVQYANDEDSDSEGVLLMAATKPEVEQSEFWYLDTGCSNHMTCNKYWFKNWNMEVKRKVMFADNSSVTAEGIGSVNFMSKDGQSSYINDVLYVPSMKNNLLSLGQLLQKGFSMRMEESQLVTPSLFY